MPEIVADREHIEFDLTDADIYQRGIPPRDLHRPASGGTGPMAGIFRGIPGPSRCGLLGPVPA